MRLEHSKKKDLKVKSLDSVKLKKLMKKTLYSIIFNIVFISVLKDIYKNYFQINRLIWCEVLHSLLYGYIEKKLLEACETNVYKRNVEKLITSKDDDLRLEDIFPFHQSLFHQQNNYKDFIDIGDFRPSAIFKEGMVYNIQYTPTNKKPINI